MALSNILKKGSYAVVENIDFHKESCIRFNVHVYSNKDKYEFIGTVHHSLVKPQPRMVAKSRTTKKPPTKPKLGDVYVVPEGCEEAWGCSFGATATWSEGDVWNYMFSGIPIYIEDEKETFFFDGVERVFRPIAYSEQDEAWRNFFSKEALEKNGYNVLKSAYDYLKVFYSDSAPKDC
jgi:hypothetical protein